MANSKLNLTRDQLALFLKDHESIKQFERLFATVDAIAPDFVNEVAISAGTAQATANDALALIEALENSLTADTAVTDAKATLALQELQALKSELQLKALEPAEQYEQATINLQNQFDTAPAAPQLGTIASYNLNGSPTTGGVGYGTGSAVAFTPAGTSGQFLTSAGSGTPTWTNISSFGVSSFSAGTTGLTPSTATTGAVTLAGTLAVANGGTGVTSSTGSGSVVLSTSPTLVTPLLGTPTSGDFSTGTFTWPTFNQNTTGSAAKWTTARTLAGNSVDGSANVAFANKFIVQGTTDAGLSGAQFLGALGTGIVKNTTTTGVLSIAVAATDYVAPSAYSSANGLTMATSRLLGRTTALSGAAEEISVAGGLTLTGGVLTGTSGTVTAVSVASANGFAGTSSGGATPALTLSTTITGVLKGNATAISAATAGTDYSAGTSALATGILKSTTTTGALTIAVAADFPTLNQNTTGSAGSVANAVTFNNSGAGAVSGTTFNGGAAQTISYNTIGAQAAGTYVTSVTGTAPVVSSGGATPAISMAAATTAVSGYLTSTDWTTFNGKQAALVSGTNIKTVSGTSLLGSGDLGTIGAIYGGTGQSSYAVGDLLYASTTTALSKLADVATGNALISGGVGVAPAWGKIGLTTHVSGTLPVANGGTGTATAFTTGSVVFAGASGVYTQDAAQLFWDATNNRLGVGTGTPSYTIHSTGIIGSTLTGAATTGAGQLYLNGATSNRIDFNTNGAAAPAFTTRSAGTKICLNPQVAAAAADYAFGIATNALWSSVPTSTQFFSWYAGTTEVLRMKGNGELIIGNGDTAAVPVAANLRGTNASGTDITGADMRVHGGRGTGLGSGGHVRVFTTPPGAATGAALNTEVEAITVGPQGDIGFGTTAPTNFSGYKSIYMENTTSDGVSLTWQSTLVTAYLDVSDALGVTLVAATTHPVSISSGGIEAANFTTSQRTLLGGVTENASGGVLQLSEGITFPATQVASADANTLDDYEEGSFTPTIVGTTTAGTGTYTLQVGRYTKIGRSVNIQFRVTWTAHTGTGNMTIGGLPFTSLTTANTHASVSFGYASNVVYTAGATPMGFIAPNTTVITLVQMPSGGGAMANVALDTAGDYMISAKYITA